MKTINDNFRKLSVSELSETKGGYYVYITKPDGTRVRIIV